MSRLLDNLLFFRKTVDTFSGRWGAVTRESRAWEEGYRRRWDFDKIVRSTHGVNCTGSCSWQVHVKSGIVMYETQQTDYPRTRNGIPNHEPRGCQRGASCSWYIYHKGRLRYPMVRRALLEPWRRARKTAPSAVDAWAAIVNDPETRRNWVQKRGKGGFLRSTWDEVNEIVSAAHVHTAKTWGPDRVSGFAPIPAYSMVSYGSGTRYLSLIGGTCISFYDWYCDLPPSSPQTWGEQTDVPESASWFGAGYLILWGSNVAQTRSPDAHFFSETRYHGTKTVAIFPDFADTCKFADLWMHPRQGTDAALAMAMGHVIFTEFHVRKPEPYFLDYCRRYTDMPMLVRLERQGDRWIPGRYLRASDFSGALGERSNAMWKTVARDAKTGRIVAPLGSMGFRWGEDGRWNLEPKDAGTGEEVELELSQIERRDEVATVAFPYYAGSKSTNTLYGRTDHPQALLRGVPVTKIQLADGEALVATVYDLLLANYGVDRGLGGEHVAKSYDDVDPYSPAWAEAITGVPRQETITVAREFAETAARTRGKAMILIGASTNHWYHGDMTYRAVIAMLIACGTIGRPNGGWAHYVGQECIRPEEGWATFSFALDWQKPPRQVPGTTYFYTHTDQFRYESVTGDDLLSPTAPDGPWSGALIDYAARAERMGWSGTAALDSRNPLDVAREIEASSEKPDEYVAKRLKAGDLRFASMDPDAPGNWPRCMTVWRSNLFGASGKGHEYFLKHLVGATNHGVIGEETPADSPARPKEVVWRDEAPVGKLDLLVTVDFRMSSTALYSDIVLPTATWYEKNDVSTTDMHPFVHPLGEAISPVWESRSDWDIFKGFAAAFDTQAKGHLAPCKDVVIAPLGHDTAGEIAQAFEPLDWGHGDVDPIPGRTTGRVALVERDYGNIHARFTALGPNVREAVESKGIEWPGAPEYELLQGITGKVEAEGPAKGAPRIESDIDAVETLLALSSATNGQVSLRAFEALSKKTGRDHTHFVGHRSSERIRYHDIVAQPRKAITTPTWSGLMNEEVSYSAFQQNVDDLIPWRTLTGRQQLYLDHAWMRAFGEGFALYKPPVDLRAIETKLIDDKSNGNPQLVLSLVTPHQKWGIHSSYTDNLVLLSLARGGPILWISEPDAAAAGIADNDWIEAYNVNGALAARAVVASRIPPGLAIMYHAQDKTVNTPGAEANKRRGLHNSVTRVVLKPTHMIGGYAQLSYAFNYYGPIGSNRDTVVVLRKMRHVDWLDGTPVETHR